MAKGCVSDSKPIIGHVNGAVVDTMAPGVREYLGEVGVARGGMVQVESTGVDVTNSRSTLALPSAHPFFPWRMPCRYRRANTLYCGF